MNNFDKLKQLEEELDLSFLEKYDENGKYINTTKIKLKCTYEVCNVPVTVQFVSLLRSKRAYCKHHRYSTVGEKISKSLSDKNQPIYDENRIKLYKLAQELSLELIGEYDLIDIKSDTEICYKCSYVNCIKTGTKQFHSLVENKLAYCNEHHYLLHNAQINHDLREQHQETYDKYNTTLDKFKNKYPQVNLTWDRDNIWSQSELTFNCINPRM